MEKFRKENTMVKYDEEVRLILEHLTDSFPKDEIQVLKDVKLVEKATRKESNVYVENFFRNESLFKKVLLIGENYHDNVEILQQILFILGTLSKRYAVDNKEIYAFF